MEIFCIVLGILCIGYYVMGIKHAGYAAVGFWCWLAAGIAFVLWGGARIVCQLAKCPFFVSDGVLIFLRAVLLIAIVGFCYLEYQISRGMKQKGVEHLDYIIVLGCQVKGKEPSKALKERLDTAAKYLKENPATIAVLSGGQGPMEEITEAECMRKYLRRAGIHKERLLIEKQSRSTKENLVYSKQYIDAAHDEVGLVTNNFHIYRSVSLARKLGYRRACGIAAPCKSIFLCHYLVREAFALIKEIILKNI